MSRDPDLIGLGCSPGMESLQTSTGVSNKKPRPRTVDLQHAGQAHHQPPLGPFVTEEGPLAVHNVKAAVTCSSAMSH